MKIKRRERISLSTWIYGWSLRKCWPGVVGTLEKEKAGALGIGGVMKTFDYKAKEFIFCLENHLKLEYGGIK